jgi:signal peptidase I
LVDNKELENEDNIYYLTARWSNAKWVYTNEWFIVLKWSRWPKTLVDSMIKNKWYAFRNRPKLMEKWIIKEDGDEIVFQEDYLFKSPSW